MSSNFTPPSLPSTKYKKACLERLREMDQRYRSHIKHLTDQKDLLTEQIDRLRDVNHYLVENNRRLLRSINLMRIRSDSSSIGTLSF